MDCVYNAATTAARVFRLMLLLVDIDTHKKGTGLR